MKFSDDDQILGCMQLSSVDALFWWWFNVWVSVQCSGVDAMFGGLYNARVLMQCLGLLFTQLVHTIAIAVLWLFNHEKYSSKCNHRQLRTTNS